MQSIDDANRETVQRMLAADPVLVDVRRAGDVIEGLNERVLLHAGPPIEWARMCGPMQGAICGAAVLEGWVATLDDAKQMAEDGDFSFHPNHHFNAVGPMTGITTQNMMVFEIENRAFGNRTYCTLNEGLGKVLRYGGNEEEVLERLRWLSGELGPMLGAGLRALGGLPLKGVIARGLAMGDEMHQRNAACTSLFIRELAPSLARTAGDGDKLGRALEFIGGNDLFFLNIAMPMAKSITDPAMGIEGSSVVTTMARNGTEFGIRVSGTGDDWFTAPCEMPEGMYLPGFTEADANPDLGDSTITETIGLGSFAMATSPAVAGFLGAGSAADALNYTRAMLEITCEQNPEWTIPALDFVGLPTGIDIRKVVETGSTPTINTGIAHREAGVGQVGAGIVRAPFACFEKALIALADRMGVS